MNEEIMTPKKMLHQLLRILQREPARRIANALVLLFSLLIFLAVFFFSVVKQS